MRPLLISIAFGFGVLACAGQDAQQPGPPQVDTAPQTQQPTRQKVPTGTLTGSVDCADTNLPARGAKIFLIRASENSSGFRNYGTTDLEGRFALASVHEGTYYVVAVLPGYVNLLSDLTDSHLNALTEEERKKLLAEVPNITISADQPAQVAIRLERGAEIDGTVHYDDGSPAIGLQISLRPKSRAPETGNTVAPMMNERIYAAMLPNLTDDRGQFRILGVPQGEYLVSVSVPTASAEQAAQNRSAAMLGGSIGAMDVYVGGGLRPSQAETIKVDAGGASKDADITIPLSKLHTVRGQVVLKSTGQPPPSAVVQLLYADTKELARMTDTPNGQFEIQYVPEGSFLLLATAGREPLPDLNFNGDSDDGVSEAPAFSYSVDLNAGGTADSGQMSLALTESLDHLIIEVPDPPANQPVSARQDAPPTDQQEGPQ